MVFLFVFRNRRLSGAYEARSATFCPGGTFFCTGRPGDLNRAGGSPFPGGRFFAEIQRENAPSADGKNVPRPAAGQEGRHQGFYPLNSHFLLFLSPAQTRERRPLRKGERQSGYHSVSFVKYSQFADSVLLHMSATLRRARHNRVAQFLGTLYRKAPANLSVWHNLSSRVLSVITH